MRQKTNQEADLAFKYRTEQGTVNSLSNPSQSHYYLAIMSTLLKSNMQDTDPTAAQVIVVGAGLSGLQAAYDLQQAGISCLVLEARDRVGGKLWSVPSTQGRGNVELGGAWTNDVNQPHVMKLVKKFDLEMIKQNTSGDYVMEGHGTMPYGTDPKVC
jgi:monoamine oxidase